MLTMTELIKWSQKLLSPQRHLDMFSSFSYLEFAKCQQLPEYIKAFGYRQQLDHSPFPRPPGKH